MLPFLTMSAGPRGPTHERVAYQIDGRNAARSVVRSSDPRQLRQDLGAVLGDGDRVLEVGGQRAVAGDDGPAVGLDLDLVAAEREHRLDGEAEARLELMPRTPVR